MISLQSKGLSRVFSNTTIQKQQFFSAQLRDRTDEKRLAVEVGYILEDRYVNEGCAGTKKSEPSPEARAWVKKLSLGQFPK